MDMQATHVSKLVCLRVLRNGRIALQKMKRYEFGDDGLVNRKAIL